MKRKLLYLFLGFSLFLILGSFFSYLFLLYNLQKKKEVHDVIFEIRLGEDLISIARRLHNLGLIDNHVVFYILSKKHYKDFKAGEYALDGFISIQDLIDMFKLGSNFRRDITVIPCWTIYHIADELINKGIIYDRDEFIKYSFDRDFLRKIGLDYPSVEGFLYPDKYFFFKGTHPKDIIAKMVENFFVKLGKERIQMLEKSQMGLYKSLILASIIESEAQFEFEKPIISSVYLNRMKIGMPLQADPTVMYGLKIFTRPPKPSDFKIDNEYNTYTRRGLPPTPICNPIVSSLDAVLKPKKTKFLYFVARPDGTHFFSETYDQHLKSIERSKYERALKKVDNREILPDYPSD